MYYYILDYNQNQHFTNFQKKLKDILTNLNISGEMAISSPARSAEELAQMAIERGYTTVVAVGGDLLVNRLASILATSQVALGVIPYNVSQEIAELFSGNDLKNACMGLKQRKTQLIDLGLIKPNKYFLSSIDIFTEKSIKSIIEVDDKYSLEGEIYQLTISRQLKTHLFTAKDEPKKKWWKRETAIQDLTKFQAKDFLNIYTAAPVSVMINDFEIAKTPIKASIAKEVLKIIINRDTIN